MIYSILGGISVADVDATTTVRNFPEQWSLKPWVRPDNRPDVRIPDNWNQMGLQARIDLARTTMVEGRAGEIENASQADQAIYEYLAGTRHPESAS